MILNSTRRLQIVLAGAITANDLPVIVDYEDTNGTSVVSDTFVSSTNGVTAVDIAVSPDSNTKRKIVGIQVYNRDTAAAAVQISVVTGASSAQLTDVTLQVDDVLTYTDGGSWKVTDANGNIKQNTSTATNLSLVSANAFAGAASPTPITGLAAAQGGALTITGGTSSTAGNAGGAVTVTGGTPGATGVGGAASVAAGAGGATSGNGGVASVTGGAGTNGNGVGGVSKVVGGAGNGSGAGGEAQVIGGAGGATGTGGQVSITGGAPTDAAGGAVVIAGAAGVGTNRAGGLASVTGGASTGNATGGVASLVGGAGSAATGVGGAANVTGGAGNTTGAGGAVAVTGGSGGNDAVGGAATIVGGAAGGGNRAGGASSVTGGAGAGTGNGGASSVVGGASGAGATGDGGDVSLTGGAAASTNGSGGAIILTGGTKAGTGVNGMVIERSVKLAYQPAQTAKTTSATLTAAEVLAGIITVAQGAGGASAQQLPLATDMDTAIPDSIADDSFDFSVINISTAAAETASVTTNTGWTLVGNMLLAANTAVTDNSQGRFRASKTGTGAWSLYRIA